jgi:membrane protein implicated in regulation of membrane protease activity
MTKHVEKGARMFERGSELNSGRPGPCFLAVVGGATLLILLLEFWEHVYLQNILTGALAIAVIMSGVRVSAIRAILDRRKKPARGPLASKARQLSDRMVEQPYRLRNGDGIPHSHLWWF